MGSNSRAPRRERRHARRPQNGDMRACEECGKTAEFSERYRFEGEVVPAWVCENPACRDQVIVRRPGSPIKVESRKLIHGSKETRARATRTMMRSRARVDRAQKALVRSKSLQQLTQPSAPADATDADPGRTAVVITDTVSRIVTLDEHASRLLNVSARRIGERRLVNFFTTAREELLAGMLRVLGGDVVDGGRMPLRPRERGPVTVLVKLSAQNGHIRWELTPAE